jgi:hypothetical protein
LKAGAALQVRFRHLLPSKVPLGKPDLAPRRLFSNEVSLKLRDDHPTVMAGEADLPPKWADSTELVYREHVPLSPKGYSALRIDGAGRVWLLALERGKESGRPAVVRTEAVLSRDRLDRLAQFLRDQKVWELATLAPGQITGIDEGESRLSLCAGRGTLVRTFPNSLVRDEPRLLRLRAEMEDIRAAALKSAAAKKAPP